MRLLPALVFVLGLTHGVYGQEVPGASLPYLHELWQSEDGLAHNSVNAVLQTSDGYLWLGTAAGLVRFDGVAFYTPADPSVRNQYVWALHEDHAGRLWIGTGGGLVRYADGQFTRFTTDDGLPINFVRALYEDQQGRLWVGTYGGGLCRFSEGRLLPLAQPSALPNNFVHALAETADGALWIGTEGGLIRMQDGQFTQYTTAGGLSDDAVRVLHTGADGTLWIGTGRGLTRINEGVPAPFTAGSRYADLSIRALFTDRKGVLWVGTESSGLLPASGYTTEMLPPLSHNDVRAVYEDREGSLWIGTNGGGLNRYKQGRFKAYGREEGLPSDVAFTIFEDRRNALWIGTSNGLSRFENDRFTTYSTRDGLSNDIVFSIHEDRDGTLWVGTNGGGLNRLREGRFTTFDTDDGLPSDVVFSLYEDRSGRLWVGTSDGIARFRDGRLVDTITTDHGLPSGLIISFLEDSRGVVWMATDAGLARSEGGRIDVLTTADGLSHNAIRALHEDDEGTLWIGTRGGLSRRLSNGRIDAFTSEHGLPDDVIYTLFEVGDDLWCSSNKGIFRVSKHQLEAVARGEVPAVTALSYGRSDGMRSVEGNGGNQPTGWQRRDGTLWFPTLKGVVAVNPHGLETNAYPPPVYIEALAVDDRLMLRPEQLATGDPVRIPPELERFTFHYTGLSLLAPDKVTFRYRLDGMDPDWLDAGTQRQTTYTNLPPGRYTFRVIAKNHDNVWNTGGAAFTFVVEPYFYQTPWFFGLCVVLCIGVVTGLYRLRIRQLNTRQSELVRMVAQHTENLTIEKRKTDAQARQLTEQAEKLRELDRVKNRFFANISHEFRTPLTLIIGPLTDLLAGRHGALDDNTRVSVEGTLENARHLLRLINQLLDLSKLESGKMTIRPQPGDLVDFLRRRVLSLSPLAERAEIQLRFNAEIPTLPTRFDPDLMEKVLNNLLSNAIKFTPAGGKVLVTLERVIDGPTPIAEFSVKDTGCGILKSDLAHIFDRFHQASNARAQGHKGTGIGLSLSKELIELQGGTIEAASVPGFGSTFTVRLPVPDVPPDAVPPARDDDASAFAEAIDRDAAPSPPAPEPPAPSTDDARPKRAILVVEDHPDVRAYIRQQLAGSYQVVEAADGAEGLERARSLRPALVISDVMMPGMDGFALCRALKEDAETRHIPLILLTARASESSKLEGLEAGADDYLSKPFSADELLLRVRNQLATRHEMRKRYSEEIVVQPSDVTVTPADKVFLDRAVAVVEDHLGHSHFNVDTLADELGLSPRQLQRKLRAMTEQSPSEFIRHIRLARAARLLEQQAGTIAEVAYAVGFNKPAYFSELFKKTYGRSPSDYAADPPDPD